MSAGKIKLLPCPFCGDEPRYDERRSIITCVNIRCGTVRFPVSGDQDLKRWNTRAQAAAPGGVVGSECCREDVLAQESCGPFDELQRECEELRAKLAATQPQVDGVREVLDKAEQRLNETGGTDTMALVDTIHAVAALIREARAALTSENARRAK